MNPRLWWPVGLVPPGQTRGYRYSLLVSLSDPEVALLDVYRLPFGIRKVTWNSRNLMINGRPLYCHGVNKHEDADIRGRGFDRAVLARDFALLEWLGVNCVRTSHYPYSEEFMELADSHGIAVIDELPAVGLTEEANFSPRQLALHKRLFAELYARDRNRASVVMWSLANEPDSTKASAGDYFKEVFGFARAIDQSRPLTFACSNQEWDRDRVMEHADVMALNRYFGWYADAGHLELIGFQLNVYLNGFYSRFQKPIIMMEYGADTVAGLHKWPSVMFSEEFQGEYLKRHHRAFDVARRSANLSFIGEMIWNFADFQTGQATIRIDGNKKGLFTRQRQPKLAAHLVRKRYRSLIDFMRK